MLHAKDAALFALLLLRTDAPADGREAGGLLELGDGAGGIALADQLDESADVNAHGAAEHALGLLALNAPTGLDHCHVVVVAEGHFIRIGRPQLRRLLWNGRAGYVQPLWLSGRLLATNVIGHVRQLWSPSHS